MSTIGQDDAGPALEDVAAAVGDRCVRIPPHHSGRGDRAQSRPLRRDTGRPAVGQATGAVTEGSGACFGIASRARAASRAATAQIDQTVR